MLKKSKTTTYAINLPSDEDMQLINDFALKELKKDEVFTFSVILCDNDIDRDFERFSIESLKSLEKLFVGKTGILNHSMKSEDQYSRVYKTKLFADPQKKTSDGETYTYLKAWCYTLRCDKNEGFIRDIEGGIKKEVSVSCASSQRVCSICCESHCNHIAGRKYNGERCYKTIEGITDAYEWSFVAVPAQRQAGVTKSFNKEKNMENILKSIKENDELSLKKAELKKLSEYINSLEEKSVDGEKYRTALSEKAKKGFALVIPSLDDTSATRLLKGLSAIELESICKALDTESAKLIPVSSQLYREDDKHNNANNEFKF